VNYPVYGLGCGINVGNLHVDVAYEYSDMKYVDTWSNAVSINRQITNNVCCEFLVRAGSVLSNRLNTLRYSGLPAEAIP